HNPDLADRWQALGELLRYSTSLTPRQSELAILITGRACRSPFEWYAHRIEADKVGIEREVIEAILAETRPPSLAVDDAIVYDFATELNRFKSVSDATYAKALARFGERTVVELTALIGYYTMVAMTLNAHEIPLPEGVEPAFPLPQQAEVEMSAAMSAAQSAFPAAGPSAQRHRDVAGWDCHAHLFGPYAQFPLAPDRSYTPPEALEQQYVALLARLGLAHGVLVHPSAYGEDYALLLHALAARPQLRGVIVARAQSLAQRPDGLNLEALRARGVRAARFSHRSGAGANFAGSASFEDLQQMAGALAAAGLHCELWTDCTVLPDIAPALRQLPLPVVIDHMGGFDPAAGVDDAGFRTLLALLESGNVWVKLCAYRNFLHLPSLEGGRVFQQKMIEANPDRLVWGSDWPHLRVKPAPDAAALLQAFIDWTGDDALVEQILVRNPAALYA
ncbi:MAG TPA: amidohydrolase family protein, partial [Burkholderiaceae bacterium]|nr:amidohydrolase family protein [Burkholderiaceae bacterium]